MTREEALLRHALAQLLEWSSPASYKPDVHHVTAQFPTARWDRWQEAKKRARLAMQGLTPEQAELAALNEDIQRRLSHLPQHERKVEEAEKHLQLLMQQSEGK